MIKIINYGLGNVTSFLNVYKSLDIPCGLVNEKSDLKNTTHLILPGVGSFDFAMNLFLKSGLKDDIEYLVRKKNIPILGVCVGMQILGNSSEEGIEKGLGWIPGKVKKIKDTNEKKLPLPHMGWNSIDDIKNNVIFNKVDLKKGFYFLHSYYFETDQYDIASCIYSNKFCCAINFQNVYGVQFHPEKSHFNGIQLLKNFSEI